MIPSISYPEATAKVRVINLQDQLIRTVNTVHKAGTVQVTISKELNSANCTAIKKELLITDNLPIHPRPSLYTPQMLEQAYTSDNANLTYTERFIEFGQD